MNALTQHTHYHISNMQNKSDVFKAQQVNVVF